MNAKATAAPAGELFALFAAMQRIRCFEERVSEMFVRGATAGSMLHLSIGEEAVAGICARMQPQDSFTTHHRGHGVHLARGADPKLMMAEIAGKAAGYCRGKGGSMHIASNAIGSLGANAIVGGGIPHSVGAAYAYRLRDAGRVSVAFFGDGALQQGLLYECMNMAALWKLPVLFACINNQYGMGTNIRDAAASSDFCGRASAFGLACAEAKGDDAGQTAAAAGELLEGARGGRPALLMLECYRFFGHARMDKSPYRDPAEEEEGRKRDPLAAAKRQLLEEGTAASKLDEVERETATEMDAALDFAAAAPDPQAGELWTDVYAPETIQPMPVGDRIRRALESEG